MVFHLSREGRQTKGIDSKHIHFDLVFQVKMAYFGLILLKSIKEIN
jgi:hypothetical protein